MIFKEVRSLFKKEILLEWRQKFALNGILLYIISTVFICYLSFGLKQKQINPATWNALFWIIMLFTAVSAVTKSFAQERGGRFLYYYTLASPEGIILSKIIYNSFLMMFLTFIGYFFFSIINQNPVADKTLFLINLAIGSIGFSSTLTMVSGIVSKVGNNTVLMSILSFPIMLPMLLMLIKISMHAIDGLDRSLIFDELTTLIALNAIVIALSYLLFPFLWRS